MTDSGNSLAPAQQPRRRWFVFLLVVMATFWAAAVVFRWELRAQWWAYQAVGAESPEERRLQVIRLASIGDKSLNAVDSLLQDPRPEVREAGVDVLRYCQSEQAASKLMDMLADGDPDVTGLAATALAMRKDRETYIGRLEPMLRQQGSAWAAAIALGRIGGTEAEKLLMQSLSEEQAPEVRAQLIDSLGMLSCRRAVPLIREARRDSRPITLVPFSQLSARRAIAALSPELHAKGVDPQQVGEAASVGPTVGAVAEHWLRLLNAPGTESAPAATEPG